MSEDFSDLAAPGGVLDPAGFGRIKASSLLMTERCAKLLGLTAEQYRVVTEDEITCLFGVDDGSDES